MAKLNPDPIYLSLKANLSQNARGTLRWVEQAIEEDPSPDHPARFQLEDGAILDVSAEDRRTGLPIRVVYRILDPENVTLELVFDESELGE